MRRDGLLGGPGAERFPWLGLAFFRDYRWGDIAQKKPLSVAAAGRGR